MTPIAGLFHRHGASPSAYRLAKISEALRREFDTSTETWTNEALGLTFGRTNATPLHCEAGLIVLADARLDDRLHLAQTLGSDPSLPDAALIAAAWRRWGEACPEHLIGDYAFAVWDPQQRSLFCARDHVGARPFYYVLNRQIFAFGSHIGVLQQAWPGLDELDPRFIATALADRRFEPLDRTYCLHVRKLPPGCRLTVTPEDSRMSAYWRPEDCRDVRFAKHTDYVEAARELVERAVADRVRSARRIAVHLSGGLDSSVVAALATGQLRAAGASPPDGYAWHPREGHEVPGTEPAWTEAVRAHLGLEVYAPACNRADLAALLRIDRTNQPDSRNLFHELAVQRHAAACGTDLVLSGWGGDEGLSFNGRGYRAELLRGLRLLKLARQARKPTLREGARQFSAAWAEHRAARQRFPSPEQFAKSYLSEDFLHSVTPYPSPHVQSLSYRQAQAHLLRRTSITQRLEDWAISGARHGISYGYPLLDRRVLAFAYGLPPDLYQGAPMSRMLMRELARPWLPDAVRMAYAKIEPLRVASMHEPFTGALRDMAAELVRRQRPPSRAHYIDMGRLVPALQLADQPAANRSAMRLAVQFLDFDGQE